MVEKKTNEFIILSVQFHEMRSFYTAWKTGTFDWVEFYDRLITQVCGGVDGGYPVFINFPESAKPGYPGPVSETIPLESAREYLMAHLKGRPPDGQHFLQADPWATNLVPGHNGAWRGRWFQS